MFCDALARCAEVQDVACHVAEPMPLMLPSTARTTIEERMSARNASYLRQIGPKHTVVHAK
jgi:hypothetical protein